VKQQARQQPAFGEWTPASFVRSANPSWWSGALAALVSLPIRVYRMLISPLLPPACRFYPSCSRYALDALGAHGLIRGTWLSVARLLKCHPFHPGGVDPVPPREIRSQDPSRGRGN
jgi:uncharacterized protein